MQRLFRIGLLFFLIGFLANCGGGEAPTAEDQAVNTDEDTPVDITLSAEKAPDVDSAIIYAVDQPPEYGRLTGSAPNLTYQPVAGFIGQDEFTFTASQDGEVSDPATVTILVAPDLDIKDTRPEPAYLQKAQPLSETELSLEWLESLDDSTSPAQIQYDVHISQDEGFFPTPENLVETITGETAVTVTGLEPGFRYYVKVIAVDNDGQRSLETKPLSVKMAYQSFVTREDVNIYLAEDFLANPIFDEENAVIEFEITAGFLPEAGEFILLNPDDGASIYRVETVDLVGATSTNVIASSPDLVGRTVRIGVAPSDMREVAAYGDVNISVSHDTNSGGFRIGGLPFDNVTGTIGDIYEYTETNFNCMDENRQNPRITLYKATDSSFVHLDGGVEIACDLTIEINNNYGYALDQYPDIEEAEPEVLKGGAIRTKGDVRLKLFANMGFNVGYDSLSNTIWSKEVPFKGTFKVNLTILKPLTRVKIDRDIEMSYLATPTLSWKYGGSAGSSVDVVTSDIVTMDIDERITYEKTSPFPTYTFDRESLNGSFEPQFNEKYLFAKASQETEFEAHIDFLLGIRVNMQALERLGVTTGVNNRFSIAGKTTARENYGPVSQHIPDISLQEMKSLSLTYNPSIKSSASINVSGLGLPGWIENLGSRYLSVGIVDVPLGFGDYVLLNIPHYSVRADVAGQQYNFTAELLEGTGTGVGILESGSNWHDFTNSPDFQLTEENLAETPSAIGVLSSGVEIEPTVVLEYVPNFMGPLLERDFGGLDSDYLEEFRKTMTKYAFSGPVERYEYGLVDCFHVERVNDGYTRDTNRTAYGIDRQANLFQERSGHIGVNSYWQEYTNTYFFPVVDGFYAAQSTEPTFIFFDIYSVYPGAPANYLFVDDGYELPSPRTNIEYPHVMENSYVLINNAGGYSGYEPGLTLNSLVITDEIYDQEIPSHPPVPTDLNFECSLVPEGSDFKEHLLGLPFNQACVMLNSCMRQEMQARLDSN